MNHAAHNQEMTILVFEIMGIRMGIDARQIARTTAHPTENHEAVTLYYFHEKVAFREKVPDYRAPAILHPAANLALDGALIVDHLHSMRTINQCTIRRLPRWLASQQKTYWGIAVLDEGLLLLANLANILEPAQKPAL